MKIAAFDPGKNTGWATFDTDVFPIITGVGICRTFEELFWKLEKDFLDVEQFVCEDYFINTKKFDHQWDKGPAMQMIGAIKYEAARRGIPIKMQPNNVKSAGYGYVGIPNKHKHDEDAIVHGVYYVIKKGLIKVEELKGGPRN